MGGVVKGSSLFNLFLLFIANTAPALRSWGRGPYLLIDCAERGVCIAQAKWSPRPLSYPLCFLLTETRGEATKYPSSDIY